MDYIYALNIFESKLSIGLYRQQFEALVFEREDTIVSISSLSVNAKVAVMGMNAFTQTDSNSVVLGLPSHYNCHDIEHIKNSLAKEGVTVYRTLSNTSALALYSLTLNHSEEEILVIINDGTGYSVGAYELGGGVVETLCEYYFRHNPNVVDWAFLKSRLDITKIYYVGDTNTVYSRLVDIVNSYLEEVNIQIVSSSWIINGCAIYSAILTGDIADMVLLRVIPDTLSVLSEKTYMIQLTESGLTIPFLKIIELTTTHDKQNALFVEIYRRDYMKKCGLKQDDEFPVQVYWVYGIKPAKKQEVKVEMKLDVDEKGVLKVTFYDPENKSELRTVKSENTQGMKSTMTTEQLEFFRPALYYQKDV